MAIQLLPGSRGGDTTYLQAGIYGTPQNLGPVAALAVINNRMFLSRFTVPRTLVILSGGLGVSVAANTDDSCRIGIYDGTLANLLGSSVSTAGQLNSTGNKVIQLQAAVTLTPGNVYYSAFIAALAGTAAQFASGNAGNAFFVNLFGATAGVTLAPPTMEYGRNDPGSLTLPASIASPATTTQGPCIAWRTTT